MILRMWRSVLILAGCSLFLAGCGAGSSGCTLTENLAVSPASATADHSSASPGNQIHFTAFVSPSAPPGCPIPEWVAQATPVWTNPEPLEISISSAQSVNNGLATCLAATSGPVTLTATIPDPGTTPITKTTTLTCQ